MIIGILNSAFISESTDKPSSIPTPLKESIEVRVALSKDYLKMNGTSCLKKMFCNASHIFKAWSLDSITQGPAITGSNLPPNRMFLTETVTLNYCELN